MMLETKETIKKWLKGRNIENYTINDDLTVDVDDNVSLTNYYLIRLPVQFGTINGDFLINKCFLKTLKGCPHKVAGKFDCSNNNLKSLDFCPTEIGRSFICDNNEIETLDHTPKIVRGDMMFNNNPLKNLNGFDTNFYQCFIHNCKEEASCIPELKSFYHFYKNLKEYIIDIPREELTTFILQQTLQEELTCNQDSKIKKIKI